MPKLAITMSEKLYQDIESIAEKDSPGAPNRSATALRILARGVKEELRGGPTTRADVAPIPRHRDPPMTIGEAMAVLGMMMRDAPKLETDSPVAPAILPAPDHVAPVPPEISHAQATLRRRRAEAGLDPDTGRPMVTPRADSVAIVDAGKNGAPMDPGAPRDVT